MPGRRPSGRRDRSGRGRPSIRAVRTGCSVPRSDSLGAMSFALVSLLAGGLGAAAMIALAWGRGRRSAVERLAVARTEAKLLLKSAQIEGAAVKRAAETEAREH